MSWLEHHGTLTPDTIREGMHVRIHYYAAWQLVRGYLA